MPTKTAARALNFWALLLAVIVTTSCTPPETGPDKLDDYLTRLGRATSLEVPAPPFIAPPRINDAELTPIELAPSRIGVLEFLSLSGCDLQLNLGRRNSSLGRHASPSQRLLLDLEFLQLAPSCMKFLTDKGDTDLASEIGNIAAARKQALPATIYNAIFTGPEFRFFWQLPTALKNYPDNTSGEVIDALNWLNQSIQRWLSGDYRENAVGDNGFGNGALEQQLSILRAGDGGTLMLAVAVQARAMTQGTALLQTRAQQRALCPAGHETEAAKIIRTVVINYFAADVQAWLARLNHRERALMGPLRIIEAQLETTLPKDYQAWRARRDALLTQLQAAPKAHVQAVKSALNQCPALPWAADATT